MYNAVVFQGIFKGLFHAITHYNCDTMQCDNVLNFPDISVTYL